jgi:hypothetical protein
VSYHPENKKADNTIDCLKKEFYGNSSTCYDGLTSSSNYDSQSCHTATARKDKKGKAFFELDDTPMSSN